MPGLRRLGDPAYSRPLNEGIYGIAPAFGEVFDDFIRRHWPGAIRLDLNAIAATDLISRRVCFLYLTKGTDGRQMGRLVFNATIDDVMGDSWSTAGLLVDNQWLRMNNMATTDRTHVHDPEIGIHFFVLSAADKVRREDSTAADFSFLDATTPLHSSFHYLPPLSSGGDYNPAVLEDRNGVSYHNFQSRIVEAVRSHPDLYVEEDGSSFNLTMERYERIWQVHNDHNLSIGQTETEIERRRRLAFKREMLMAPGKDGEPLFSKEQANQLIEDEVVGPRPDGDPSRSHPTVAPGYGRPTFVHVNLANLNHNLGVVRSRVGANVQVMGVVKANAYGHGISRIAKELVAGGADSLGVVRLEELAEARNALAEAELPQVPILLITKLKLDAYAKAIELGGTLAVSSVEELQAVNRVAKSFGKIG